MTRQEAREILGYIRMAFLPESFIEVAQPANISDKQVADALDLAIKSLSEAESCMTFDPLESSLL